MDRNGRRIEYRPAAPADAALLVSLYNAAFYADHVRYGVCPGYGRTVEMMAASIRKYPKFIILCDGVPAGCISCKELSERVYEIGCLCIVPAFQGRGLGTQAMRFIKAFYGDWKKLTLVTPADKTENIRFYTEKCGFSVVSVETDGGVALARFTAER